ncbi:hypothetical protein CP8484711_0794A, partial [Chlamydia psittaci 84-8471/1]
MFVLQTPHHKHTGLYD